ncbi:hypothetical protein N7491_007975 [Penicillium cf. griseofulvum]|uniref:Uncharacterized protein n=1 Tax=Penicillium cf. griseofulvum TaxID=2972120 RepID=A0A9W9M5Z8_9EURO|nr:hypothetical protein N7472_008998 [Penicillium cf. griseofulvum]KAJ5427533.1 hypothetical protein N7491_007975 [Penicillium cf. griseofulvum]
MDGIVCKAMVQASAVVVDTNPLMTKPNIDKHIVPSLGHVGIDAQAVELESYAVDAYVGTSFGQIIWLKLAT